MNNLSDIIQKKLDADDMKKCRITVYDPVSFAPSMSFCIQAESLGTVIRFSVKQTSFLTSLWRFETDITNATNAVSFFMRSTP